MKALKVGDGVVLTDARPIVRLDYEKTIGSEMVAAEEVPEVQEFIAKLNLNPKAQERVFKAVAGDRIDKADGRRELVRGEPVEELSGVPLLIVDRRVRKTGTPVPERLIQTYDGPPDLASGYLDKEQTHVCYRLGADEWSGIGKPTTFCNFVRVGQYELPYGPMFIVDDTSDGMPWPPEGELWVTKEQVRRATEGDL